MRRPKLKISGAHYVIPLGNLGYKTYLTEEQMKELVNSLRTKNYAPKLHPQNMAPFATGFYTKEEILDFYEKNRPKVKRDAKNSGEYTRIKRKQPDYKFKK